MKTYCLISSRGALSVWPLFSKPRWREYILNHGTLRQQAMILKDKANVPVSEAARSRVVS